MQILEPYIISVSARQKANDLSGMVLVKILSAYKKLHCGSHEFIGLLTFKINSKSSELRPCDATKAYHYMMFSPTFTPGQGKLMLLEVLKKLGKMTTDDLQNILRLMSKSRIGEPSYYELLVIQVLKLRHNFPIDSLINVLENLAMADVKSKALFLMAMEEAKRFLMSNAWSIIEGGGEAAPGLSGLIGKEADQSLTVEMLEQLILMDGETKAPSDKPFNELFATTKNPVYSFKAMIDLAWSLVVFATNSNEAVDSEGWMLLVKLLNKHVRFI